jgi:nucleotide-binding universal stress UspA family protein
MARSRTEVILQNVQRGSFAMKSILVPVGGSDSDELVFDTALAAARLFDAHLQFLHVRIGVGAAAQCTPHVEFASGAALRDALGQLEMQRDSRSAEAVRHVEELCARAKVLLCDKPGDMPGVTASWREEMGDAVARILLHARHSDLTIVGRSRKSNGLPPDFIEQLLLKGGRPVLIAGPAAPQTLPGTVMICWKESADAARAVTAASPFLERAEKVILVTIAEGKEDVRATMNDFAAQLARHGTPTEVRIIEPAGRSPQEQLADAGREHAADLIVMGAYGHSHLRETLFGGCTQSFLRQGDRPILFMH